MYMHLLLEKMKKANIPITPETFNQYGQKLELFKGVDTWFDRMSSFGLSKNIEVHITTNGTVKISTELLAVSDCVFNIVNSALLAELSKTSSENVGVLPVLFVTLIDLIIKVSFDPDVNKEVSLVVAKATPLNLY